jgi:hypothetical protein
MVARLKLAVSPLWEIECANDELAMLPASDRTAR